MGEMGERLDDFYLAIQRENMTIFETVPRTASVMAVKDLVTKVLKVTPNNQRLYYNGQIMDDTKTLLYYNVVPVTEAHIGENVVCLGVTFKVEGSEDFEELNINPYGIQMAMFVMDD